MSGAAGTALNGAFGPWEGLIWASVATLVAAIVYYHLVRLLPSEFVDRWLGRWTRKMGKRFERDGIVAIMIARNVPFAPFQLVNIVGGLANIRFSDYLIGTILGMGPAILALTILGDRLRGAWDSPTLENVALLLLAIAVWFAVALGLQALSNRWVALRGRRSKPASDDVQAGTGAGRSGFPGGAAEILPSFPIRYATRRERYYSSAAASTTSVTAPAGPGPGVRRPAGRSSGPTY